MTAQADPLDELERVPCVLCGSAGGDLWGTENGYTALKCPSCGLVYVSPRPRLDTIGDAARTGMHRTESGEMSVTDQYRGVRVLLRRRLARSLWRDLLGGPPLRWLDVGAGHGELLLALRAELPAGSELRGVEPNDAKASALRRRGFPIESRLEDVEERFDVVSLMNVYGHVPQPTEFFRSLHRLLEPSGTLIIETGNGAELESRADYPDALSLPDHLSFAGEPQLRSMLTDAGFDVLRVDRRRVDGVGHLAKSLVRRVGGVAGPIPVPYRSSFRSLHLRCRRTPATDPAETT